MCVFYTIYNPLAINGKGIELLNQFKIDYSKDFEEISYYNYLEIDFEEIKKSFQDNDAIIIIGGDEILHKIINIYYKYEINCPLFMYGVKEYSDFLIDIGAESYKIYNITKYIKDLPYSIVDNEKIYFINNVGFGLDGKVCQMAVEKMKTHAKFTYPSLSRKVLLSYKKKNVTIIIDNITYQYKNVYLASTFNSRYYGGGMKAYPTLDRHSDKLGVLVMLSSNIIKAINIFSKFTKGLHKNYPKNVIFLEGHEIKVMFETPEYIQLDGDLIGEVYEYTAFKGKKPE